MEKNYEFRKYLNAIHHPDRRDESAKLKSREIEIQNGWSVIVDRNASPVIINAAKDLLDYLFISMNVSVMLKKTDILPETARIEKKCIILGTKKELKQIEDVLNAPNSYLLKCEKDRICICGNEDRGTAQGCYYFEDLMNLREAPFLKIGNFRRESLFSPRMTHSGWGIDQFPNSHLSAIAHAGMDAVVIFTKDVNMTTVGYLDFNDLVDRAASFGIDVYLYSYLKSLKHPEEEDALEYYRNTYGKVFKACPKAKGIILVGESCEFPSRDTINTTGKLRNDSKDDSESLKPSPGWWPCMDYPEWLNMIKKTVKEHSPNAEIIFWTYNWGYAPEKDRVALINSLPEDITLMVTFEMFEQIKKNDVVYSVPDYTISFEGPGTYFTSEAQAAKNKNIRLYAMSNTAGMTWDFGVVPYIPVPFQWSRRHAALLEAKKEWNLSGLMESHHYGFYPSVVSELAKWSYWSSSIPAKNILEKLAERDFSKEAIRYVIKCWKLWSNAIKEHYIATNEDQYGPFRVGPSYPLIFHPDITRTFEPQELSMPSASYSHFGSQIIKTFYHPLENDQQSPGAIRIPFEIKSLTKMRKMWDDGLKFLEKAIVLTPPRKKENAQKMLLLGKFIRNTIITAINLKKWYLLNKRLLIEPNRNTAGKILAEMENLAYNEIDNAEKTIPIVEADSRLGWEPSMEYMTDAEHLDWKIRQVKRILESNIAVYRQKLNLK